MCSHFTLLYIDIIKSLYTYRASHSHILPDHDKNHGFWLWTKAWHQSDPHGDHVCLHSTMTLHAWGSWRFWCVVYLHLGTANLVTDSPRRCSWYVLLSSYWWPWVNFPLSNTDYTGLLPCFVPLLISVCRSCHCRENTYLRPYHLSAGPHNPVHEPFIWKDRCISMNTSMKKLFKNLSGNMLHPYICKPSYDSHLAHQTSGVLWFTNLPVGYHFF